MSPCKHMLHLVQQFPLAPPINSQTLTATFAKHSHNSLPYILEHQTNNDGVEDRLKSQQNRRCQIDLLVIFGRNHLERVIYEGWCPAEKDADGQANNHDKTVRGSSSSAAPARSINRGSRWYFCQRSLRDSLVRICRSNGRIGAIPSWNEANGKESRGCVLRLLSEPRLHCTECTMDYQLVMDLTRTIILKDKTSFRTFQGAPTQPANRRWNPAALRQYL